MSRIQLSQPLGEAKDSYDVIVVGSGYGASIAASRLARAGKAVALLERGREIRPGDYPRSATDLAGDAQIRVAKTGKRIGREDGLIDFHMNEDINVLVGCGLGGTSLINANVALTIDTRLMEFWDWPAIYHPDPESEVTLLDPYYERARQALGTSQYPDDWPELPKVAALKKSGEALHFKTSLAPINVSFEDGTNHFGFEAKKCTLCGDCCTGCNYGAKNTTLMNYLPDARAWGARLFTRAEVRHVAKADGGWAVTVVDGTTGKERVLHAGLVVLGAGTLGSTEILLRSREKGLALSKALGKRFSGNGDVLGFGYDSNMTHVTSEKTPRAPLNAVGAGPNPPEGPVWQPGPTIAAVIDMRSPNLPVRDGMVIEDGVMPGPLAAVYPAAFFMTEALGGGTSMRFPDFALRAADMAEIGKKVQSDPGALAALAYEGAINRTQTYLVMSHDRSDGVIAWENDCPVVKWTSVGREPSILRDNDLLKTASDAIWAEYFTNPLWQDEFGRKLISVHPLGGCVMSDDPEKGVVNGHCQVWTPDRGVHEGLYVCDGSVIPGALGVNPLLTISAVTEFAVETLAKARGWTIDYDRNQPLPPETTVPDPVPPPSGPTLAEMLKLAIAEVEAFCAAVDSGDRKTALGLLEKLYDKLGELSGYPLPPWWTVKVVFTDGNLKGLVSAWKEVLPILNEVEAALVKEDYTAVLKLLEDFCGDFSTGLAFKETMAGHVSTTGLAEGHPVSDVYEVDARRGLADGHEMTGHFHISAQSLQAMNADPDHRAVLSGTIDCKALGGAFDLGSDARFELLRPDADQVDGWLMVYSGSMSTGFLGTSRYFYGHKLLKKRPGSNFWSDLTTLMVDVYEDEKMARRVARGRLTLGLQDLVLQASTLTQKMDQTVESGAWQLLEDFVLGKFGGKTLAEMLRDKAVRAVIVKEMLLLADRYDHPYPLMMVRLHHLAAFLGLFAGLIFRVYGGMYAYMNDFPGREDRDAPPPGPRLYPLPEAETHKPVLPDGLTLQLTRYRGGTKGPVILAPGFGVTAASYVLPTTEVTLAEYLCHAGYDVWLFDYRGSPAIDASRESFTIDDVALIDWPLAVETVRKVTGAADVQIIAHCIGSTSVLMALLAGMEGVRSVISSQTSLHPITSWFNYAKADTGILTLLTHGVDKSMWGLVEKYLPEALQHIAEHGMKTVSMVSTANDVDPEGVKPPPEVEERRKLDQLIDGILWGAPFPGEEPCGSTTCHRVFGVYGASYAHAQLNQATHDAMHRVFGEISTKPFEQLSTMIRVGEAVDCHGRKSFFAHPENIRCPIDFIAGSDNRIFLPETTMRTMDWLAEVQPDAAPGTYTRHEFPGYAHMDMFVGRTAAEDIFPYLLERLKARGTGE